MRKLTTYSVVSFAALAAVVAHAFFNNGQFYTSMVALSQSRLFNALVSNTFMVVVILSFQLLRYVFLGKLRDQEAEKVMKNTGYFLMEIFLTLTMFNSRFSIKTVAMFVLCIFWKIFHWLAQSRLDFLEQAPAIGSSQLRLALLLVMLILGDSFAGRSFADHLLTHGASERLILLEENMVMAVMATTALLRLLIHIIDARRNRRWESKGQARFYLEIVSDVLHCIIYITFFFVFYANYGLPINLIRDLFVTVRNLYRTIRNFVNYRRLSANLDTKFPDVTEEDLAEDATCSICFDDMTPGGGKKLTCSHMFHRHCLRQWLERQTTCPYCRQSIDSAGRNAAEARDAAARAGLDEGNNNANANGNGNDQQEQRDEAQPAAATPVPSVSEAELEAAFHLYEATFNTTIQGGRTGSTGSLPMQPASPVVHTVASPTPSATLEEAKVYADFHAEMHQAYSKLHQRLKDQAEKLSMSTGNLAERATPDVEEGNTDAS
eukprot:TRINITY_DN6577_c2_g1_i1.p1 TRINITY_DN6577_c2_g1~~TRINITY_DN6577_c2_g1_i1.p1  ORF type:complete len:499 (+),score=146.63 TRINITY_DN6577_c2_g1_i1:24-1499(+)